MYFLARKSSPSQLASFRKLILGIVGCVMQNTKQKTRRTARVLRGRAGLQDTCVTFHFNEICRFDMPADSREWFLGEGTVPTVDRKSAAQ